MTDREISKHQIDSFRRLLMHLPGDAGVDLIVLKGHLLIEEQLRHIIQQRIPGHAALKIDDSVWTFDLKARLAKALCSNDEDDKLWQGIRKLNKIRNDLAHKLEPKGLMDQIDDLNQSWLSDPLRSDEKEHLLLILCLMYTALSGLVRTPSAEMPSSPDS